MASTLRMVDRGDGPAAVLLPSLGRGAADFDDLAGRLAASGRRAVAVDPPESLFPGAGMADLAVLAIEVLDDLGLATVDLVGHAFGTAGPGR